MSILSDLTIKKLCLTPTHVAADGGLQGLIEAFSLEPPRETTQEEKDAFIPMIAPFEPGQVREIDGRRVISYGTSSYGYDVRLDKSEVKIFSNLHTALIDPKKFDSEKCLVDALQHEDDDGGLYVILPPNSYMLGVTLEYFRIPRNCVADCVAKSTYARSGVAINVTPIEPGFEGRVVLEIANHTPSPVKIYLLEGIAQFRFYLGDRPCEISYADRAGKYQGQAGLQISKV